MGKNMNENMNEVVEVENTAVVERAEEIKKAAMEASMVDDHNVDAVDAEEVALKEAVAKMLKESGLVALCPPSLFLVPEKGWREVLRKRLVAIIKCHKPGATYNIKIHDLDVIEYKTERIGKDKQQVLVSKDAAISKYVSSLMARSKDKSEKLTDGTYKITKAPELALFTIKSPTTKKPRLELCFDMHS